MKKLHLIPVAALLLMSISFKSPLEKAKNSTQDWGQWINDDCLTGIDYRVKKVEYNGNNGKWYWEVQFRNRYQDKVNYSYGCGEPGSRPELDHRDMMGPNSMSDAYGFFANSSTAVHVRVGYVRMGDNDSGPYYSCDK